MVSSIKVKKFLFYLSQTWNIVFFAEMGQIVRQRIDLSTVIVLQDILEKDVVSKQVTENIIHTT